MIYIDGILTGLSNVILFGLVVGIRSAWHKENIHSFLLHTDKKGLKLFFEGSCLGFLLITLIALAVIWAGQGTIYFKVGNIWPSLGLLVTWGFGYMAVALFEKGLFRGYIMQKLLKRFSVFTAILIPSIFFGFLHYLSYPETPFIWHGVTNAFLIGIVLSIIVIRTESLMLALGFHLFWNLAQTLLFSSATVIHLEIEESLLTGSSSTPETGLLVSFAALLLLIYSLIRFRGNQTPQKQ